MFSGDLFDMLLPMLSIYQEYVRNHHYCLQVNWSGVRLRKVPGVEIYLLEAPSKSRFYQVIQTSRDSSVGRALDWRSKGPRFDPGSRHWLWALFTCHGGRITPFISQGYRFSSCSILLMVQLQIFNPHLTLFIMDMEYSIILSALYYHYIMSFTEITLPFHLPLSCSVRLPRACMSLHLFIPGPDGVQAKRPIRQPPPPTREEASV